MDLSPFKLDINELIAEFTESELTTLDDMRRLWVARKFSYIYEAVPSHKVGFVMQSLYCHAIGHMISDGSLSRRLGGSIAFTAFMRFNRSSLLTESISLLES